MKHFIAKKKLQKLGLTEKQFSRVYRFKTKTKQESKVKRFVASNKAVRQRKFYKTGLGRYVIEREMNRIKNFIKTKEYSNLSDKQQKALYKKYIKWEERKSNYQAYKAPTKQGREEILLQKQHKLEAMRAKLNAGEYKYTYTSSEIYQQRKTHKGNLESWIYENYKDLLDEVKANNKGDITDSELIEIVTKLLLESGDLQILSQGEQYGYIDKSLKEVFSPH